MENINLIESFSEFKELKNIDRATMMRVLEDVFKQTLTKLNGDKDNFDVIINIDKGDFEIWQNRIIVEDSEYDDPATQIKLSEAKLIDEDYSVGEDVTQEIKFGSFGRRAILSLRQNLQSKILELEKGNVFSKYKERIGEIITAEVYQVWKKEILLLDDEGIELILPKTEQIPGDFYRKGETLRSVVIRVEMKNNVPLIILSRTSPVFLERLFELEVPEIMDGLITIKKIVRVPGERAKVAVESYDERIDPVGACVGMKGSRIHGIVRELRNENIDVVNFTNNLPLFISRALSPAKISNIKIIEADKRAEVYLDTDQVSMAIGKGGLNINLAGQLSGYQIEVFRNIEQEEEDVNLEEFSDEIDGWIIEEFKKIGLDTAKSVLRNTSEFLVKRTDLEEETVLDVIKILKAEFE
ncbi:MAG: transcription termination/antitermination protein NusA [Bacteroidetes bacterium HGW-Bacteroidetes-21]|jgi:N utilization substance protein A|nr:MAG: transcription termination/antitermination protein NusA [Bacteroidetes bacterium HGW-Bacteroidetes-21]